MKKSFFMLLGVSVLLMGCQNTADTSHTTTTVTTTNTTTTTVVVQNNPIYFQYLVDHYKAAVEYAKNHENVQTPLSALTIAYDELKQNYASDTQVIDKSYSDLQKLLNWDDEAWKPLLTKWSNSLHQNYQQISHEKFNKENCLSKVLEQTTVEGEKVQWNIFGVTESNTYDYIVLDAYQDVQKNHLYLFTIHTGKPVVLYANSTLDQLKNSNFEPTKNDMLTKIFNEFVQPTSTRPGHLSDLADNITAIMNEYASMKGETYYHASPATQRRYYGLAVPDQIMQYGKVNDESVTFKWNSWIVGESGETYIIQDCYVNESETEVLLFCYKDDRPVILQAIEEPTIQKSTSGNIESATVYFEELTHSVLQSAFE